MILRAGVIGRVVSWLLPISFHEFHCRVCAEDLLASGPAVRCHGAPHCLYCGERLQQLVDAGEIQVRDEVG